MRKLAIRLKACPRCHGDLIPEGDPSGWDLTCLQCGYREPLQSPRGVLSGPNLESQPPGTLIPVV